MTAWPASLPQTPQLDAYQYTQADTAIRSVMDYGPDKVRRRTTSPIIDVTFSVILTPSEITTLETFYYDTIQVSGRFDWVNHLTGMDANYRFNSPPSYAQVRPDMWSVTCSTEMALSDVTQLVPASVVLDPYDDDPVLDPGTDDYVTDPGYIESFAWPSTLPQNTLRGGYTETQSDTAIRSGLSYGPDKVRRRTTTVIRRAIIPLRMTTAQVSVLETFYYNTVQVSGIVYWINHRTRAAAEYRFMGPPKYQPYGGGWWAVLLDMEIMP